jgi:hypothetical protein
VLPHALRVPLSTLREALARPAPYKFRCLVRVSGHLPIEPHSFTIPRADAYAATAPLAAAHGEPPPVPPRDASEHIYSVLLRLEDSTAAVQALVYDTDGDDFFHGVPACAMEPGSGVAAALGAKMARLLDWQRDGGTWVQVCLMSYLDARADPGLSAEQQIDGDVKRFRIFGTTLL